MTDHAPKNQPAIEAATAPIAETARAEPAATPAVAPPETDRATTHRPLVISWLGQTDYEEALALQYRLADQRAAEQISDTILLLEHGGAITMGRRALDAHILADRAELQREGIRVHRVTRGGEVTYHGRGQLVGYIIFDIRSRIKQVAALMHGIEQALIAFLQNQYSIAATSNPHHPGVWVPQQDGSSAKARSMSDAVAKIAAVGVSIQSGITIHGFALNISTDLRHFSYIVACGIKNLRHTSLAKELRPPLAAKMAHPPQLEQAAEQLKPYLTQLHATFFG